MTHILVIGRNGQLARALPEAQAPQGWRVQVCGRDQIDMSRPVESAAFVEAARPSIVINASAYTAVDKAETERDAAFVLNRDAPAAVAEVCARIGAGFVHVSTDYVFDGTKTGAYGEEDPTAPINVYGASKAEGEVRILNSGAHAAIVRTSWVFSSGDGNFLTTMLRLAAGRDQIDVVADQTGRPTWARDLAGACLALAALTADGASPGLVHFAGGGAPGSWADFATEIFANAKAHALPSAAVRPISTEQFPRPARRPANSALDTTRYTALTQTEPRSWREAVRLCVLELAPRA